MTEEVDRLDKRKQLIETAMRLFAEQGYRGTGIDQIASEAQVTKKTMYRYFASKDELILAVLRHYEDEYRKAFMERVTAYSSDPREQLLGIFDLAYRWFASERYFGCLFINAVAEHGSPAVREASQVFKQLERDYIGELAQTAGVPDPAQVADSFSLLFEGALVTAQITGRPDAAITAKETAALLLGQLLPADLT